MGKINGTGIGSYAREEFSHKGTVPGTRYVPVCYVQTT